MLGQLHSALGSDITPAHVVAVVRAALGHRDLGGPLSVAEQAAITEAITIPAGGRRPGVTRAVTALGAVEAADPIACDAVPNWSLCSPSIDLICRFEDA